MPIVQDFAADFLKRALDIAMSQPQQARLRTSTLKNYDGYLRNYVSPAIGRRKLSDLSKADVSALHAKIGLTKPVTANRVVEFIGTLWRAASDAGLVAEENNPTRSIRAFKEIKRERYLSQVELARLGHTFLVAETEGIPWDVGDSKPGHKHLPKDLANQKEIIDPIAVAALRCLLFTGARLREILHAKWEDLDIEHGLLRVFGKTGVRHIILPSPALEVIFSLDKVGPYIFPGSDPARPRHDLNRPWRSISRYAGLSGVRIHDLRHTFGATGASAGLSLPIVGKLLGHSQATSTARYGHLRDDPVREAAEETAKGLAKAMCKDR